MDPTPQHLEQLRPDVAAQAEDLVNIARAAGWPLVITSSLRNQAEQRELVRSGRSRTLNSLHLTGRAFDCDLYRIHRDEVPKAFWDALGRAAEHLGLRWGGRWSSFRDYGHFESPF